MDINLLHRFFEGSSTIEEEKHIYLWLEASESNKKVLLDERLIYDSLILNSYSETRTEKTKIKSLRNRNIRIISTWAAIFLLLIVSTFFVLNINSEASELNTLIVPPGQRINLILSDNTNLWLNANTKFSYPAKFSKNSRTVYLDGEAYFEVSENEKKPFIVKTNRGDVVVTGTTFNVESYSENGSFNTSLFEGGVDIYKNEVKLTSLSPNQKSILQEDRLLITSITDSDEYLWRQGLIAFKNKELEDILTTLEKYFAVDIIILNERLPQHTYTGKFRQSDGVDYALRVLQHSIRFVYERDDETGIIYVK